MVIIEKIAPPPHIVKYMGSKRSIIDFVAKTIESIRVDQNQRLYDLFGGSAVVSGAFRNSMPVTCNDIQNYTMVLGKTYLNNYHWENFSPNELDVIVKSAQKKVINFKKDHPDYQFEYTDDLSYDEVNQMEGRQRDLVNETFKEPYHLFIKNYSGTYWSFEQCIWIDALTAVAHSERYKHTFISDVILSSLMFAMAYCTQSTGHYAQYRDITPDNYSDIMFYRNKEILPLFIQKFSSLREYYNGDNNSDFKHEFENLDYSAMLKKLEPNSIVYADPPYQFVHYSRFYHALETLVKYDYPEISHKGRYREDRHQSPFCIKTKVSRAFSVIFKKVKESNCSLVLSYSDSGMISLDDLLALAETFCGNYKISIQEMDYKHSTMGRQGDKSRDVKEALIICVPNPA